MEGEIDPSIFPCSADPFNNYCDGFFNFLSIFSLKLTAALDIPNQQFNSCTKIDSTFFPTIAVRGQWALTRATLNRTAPKVSIKLQNRKYEIVLIKFVSFIRNCAESKQSILTFDFVTNVEFIYYEVAAKM